MSGPPVPEGSPSELVSHNSHRHAQPSGHFEITKALGDGILWPCLHDVGFSGMWNARYP